MHVARGVAQLLGHRLAEVVEHVGDDDLGALFDEQAGLGLALPTRPAGDDGDLAGQPPGHQACTSAVAVPWTLTSPSALASEHSSSTSPSSTPVTTTFVRSTSSGHVCFTNRTL